MSFVTTAVLCLQVAYSDSPATQPATQPARAPRFSINRVYDIPPVYTENYATRYLGIEAMPVPPMEYAGASMDYAPPMYNSAYPYYYYPRFRRFFFAPAPFVRGNLFNPSPFFRSPGQPGQIAPRMRGGRGGRGAAHRR